MPFPDESFSERVEVSPYREDWAAEAAGYVAVLRDAVPGARGVDHIGSTSVPGLPAKDCLDLMVRVAVLDEDVLVPALAEHGFRLRVQPLLMQRAEVWAAETGSRMPTPDEGPPVLGVDGCTAGWVGALLRGSTYDVLVAPDIAALVQEARRREPGLAVVAIDMPIGLPDERPRTTDVLARRRLPTGRKSSVFPTPSRAATTRTTYVEASAANRSALGRGLSQQAFRLVPKILDVDAFVRSGPPVTVLEAHPEVSLAEIDPDCVVPGKTTAAGAAARLAALRGAGLAPPPYARGRGYTADDLLDACAVAWTAARYVAGTAYSLPDPPEVFSDGIPAAIWV